MIFEKIIEIAKYYDWESIFRGSLKKGIDVRIQIISKIDDPDAYGSERLVIENAWFNELTLQKFENAKMIDEEYSGGFTDYYFPDLVKVR